MSDISVIIPTFNGANKIGFAIDKIWQNKGSVDLEIIVVDDGSTDDTSEQLLDLKEKFGIHCFSKSNGGPGSARNLGAQHATSEILMFLGDDTVPSNPLFFESHIRAHELIKNKNKAVLGKIIWPKQNSRNLNLTEFMIQGEGQQQFGFKYMTPWKEYDWRFFYTSNISFNKSLVDDWSVNGFSNAFYKAAFEDGEFAYRLTKNNKDFGIIYTPTAQVEHHHPYTVPQFIQRQFNCGQMADVMINLHPELKREVLPDFIINALESTSDEYKHLHDTLVSSIEGLKSLAIFFDDVEILGTENWHKDFINFIFNLCYWYGYISTQSSMKYNYSMALKVALEKSTLIAFDLLQREILGNYAQFK
jgi:glycosyltransferase involved in cell wall biosynthesis